MYLQYIIDESAILNLGVNINAQCTKSTWEPNYMTFVGYALSAYECRFSVPRAVSRLALTPA